MNALANALAHGEANAMRPTSVHAKRREGKGPHRTTPHHIRPHRCSGSPLVVRDGDQASIVQFRTREPRPTIDDCEDDNA